MNLTQLVFSAVLAMGALATAIPCTADETVRIASRGDANANYAISMIKLALKHAEKKYSLDIFDATLTGERQKQGLIEGSIDVSWTATNNDMEEHTLPVRVPLYKGLLGYRVLLMNAESLSNFRHINSRQDLLSHTFGQGRGWTDTTILKANGLTVIEANKYESLFHMVDGKRFEAFPRGVHEPWLEMKNRPELNLAVDNRVMLVYKMPFYLFVTPTRPDLAKAIEQGLLAAIDDGSFDELFFTNDTVRTVIEKVDLSYRMVFELKNPDLPPKTPLNNTKLWITLDALKDGA
jgi:hypothetical protein